MDIDISVPEAPQPENTEAQIPQNCIRTGDIEDDDIRIYIRQDVYAALEEYARADIKHERGTILLGNYFDQEGKTYLLISGYIEAKYAKQTASSLTFTHKTWDYVHREHETNNPDTRIVGWQHTHPGFGIFLSNYDLFIHNYFFNLPFQVAYVIDPIQNLRGFFQWKNSRIEKLRGYDVFDEPGKPLTAADETVNSSFAG